MASAHAVSRTDSTHQRLLDFARTALLKIFITPYATVCELYCGAGAYVDKWDEAHIGHYIGIDPSASAIDENRELVEGQRRIYTADFHVLDPSLVNLGSQLQEKADQVNVVCCLEHLPFCFENEERGRMLFKNVASVLAPGGYFFGITPDSSTIWAKYQKNVEAYHNRSSSLKPSVFPNCIRSENYLITFEVEEEKFPFFGKKYQLKLPNETSAETHCLVHFPSLLRLARDAGLDYIEIQNLPDFYDDNRPQLAGLLSSFGPNLLDGRGRLLPRSYDILGLYSTFVFQKPDPDILPTLMTPVVLKNHNLEEGDWNETAMVEDEIVEPLTAIPPSLGKISEQKGILGPGPADLRFPEAL
uniref:mRNA cap guanine-N(7) methyltransferase 2 n=1 Tax=Kalanchoe fedtschenkoi TaxID=63787 RepID=A0A7N0V3J3_KALFE